jgi:hypothetical protein
MGNSQQAGVHDLLSSPQAFLRGPYKGSPTTGDPIGPCWTLIWGFSRVSKRLRTRLIYTPFRYPVRLLDGRLGPTPFSCGLGIRQSGFNPPLVFTDPGDEPGPITRVKLWVLI